MTVGPASLAEAGVTASSWVQLSPATSPPVLQDSMAYDSGTGQIVLVGCTSCVGGSLMETWTWNGSTWTQQDPATSPPARVGASMAYDASTGQLVLFGGLTYPPGQQLLNDTWTWSGTDWTQLHPASNPSPRDQGNLAFDSSTGQMILFGGEASGGGSLGDTWSWSGSTWSQLAPAASPHARNSSSMAYDPDTGQIVLFGGVYNPGGGSADLNDTWNWDGSTWTEQAPATSPGARYSTSIGYEPGAGIVLVGGASLGALDSYTWTWNGSTWIPLTPTSSPTFGEQPLAYDASTGQLVFFGGYVAGLEGQVPSNQTWDFGVAGDFFVPYWVQPGAGCTGPAGPGFSLSGPSGCGSSSTNEGMLAYSYLAGPEAGAPGSSFTYSWVDPPGYGDQVTYGIPDGAYLNNGAGTVTLNGAAAGTTHGGAKFGKTCTKVAGCTYWKSHELLAGTHVLTVTAGADYVNVYGLWVAQKAVKAKK